MIAGPWRLRLRDYYWLQARYVGDWERAAHEAGISGRVAMVIAANAALQKHQQLTRGAKLRDGRGEVAIAANSASQSSTTRKASAPEAQKQVSPQPSVPPDPALLARILRERPEREHARAALTEPMRQILLTLKENAKLEVEEAATCADAAWLKSRPWRKKYAFLMGISD